MLSLVQVKYLNIQTFPNGLVLQKQETMHVELAPKFQDSWGMLAC